ncbi:MAG TPA: PilZ domain-containing protein [Novosphingobium sp.]
MSDGDNRHISRDSLFILADLRLEGQAAEHRVKVRNLSAGGMMGEADLRIATGDRIKVNLRNVGWIEGLVAWVQDNRFGVAFARDIDPKVVRAPAASGSDPAAEAMRRIASAVAAPPGGPLRKII